MAPPGTATFVINVALCRRMSGGGCMSTNRQEVTFCLLLASLASGEFGESRADETNPTAIELALSLRPYVDQTIFRYRC